METKKKIGIVTMPVRCNYGGALQSYALQYYLRRLGCDPLVIDCRRVVSRASACHQWVERNVLYRHFTTFARRNMQRTPRLTDVAALQAVAQQCHAVVVGSDQVWRLSMVHGVERHYFLDFVPDDVRKVAYAASFGIDDLEPCDKALYDDVRRLVGRFDALSVREREGVAICRRHWDRTAEHVLDPTLLAGREAFNPLALQARPSAGDVFYFFLGDHRADEERIGAIAASAGHRAFTVNAGRTLRAGKFAFAFYPPVESWVRAFVDARAVVTDSFHGVCFALLYGKPFYVVGNAGGGNSRIASLLELTGTTHRFITGVEQLTHYEQLVLPIDYARVNEQLALWRDKSLKYILNALEI